jgi:hypothetical protein
MGTFPYSESLSTGAELLALGTHHDSAAGHDPVESYFECITACSLDDGDCVTQCVEVLRSAGE